MKFLIIGSGWENNALMLFSYLLLFCNIHGIAWWGSKRNMEYLYSFFTRIGWLL